jgi:aminoglycoside/choline kinase family phosphotransferase
VPDPSLPPAITTCLARLGMTDRRVVALTPDASDRRYYRVESSDGPAVVLALYAAPFAPGSLPFSTVAALFAAMPLPVPRVLQEMADLGVLVLDDLGDLTLQAHVGSAPDGRHRALYERAVDHIAMMQRRGAELHDPAMLPYTLAFDVEKLMWEMDFFITHFIEGFRGVTIPPAARAALRQELTALTQELSDEPRVLCHRDYHSRNLMVVGEELFVIDFQDARMGPDTYDLVSLLRDCYVDIQPELFAQLFSRFHAATGRNQDPGRFAARFDAMGVQRHLKALGTFGYQAVARANPAYAQYVPRTLGYVRATFDRRPRFGRLRDLLAPFVPEVA